MTLPFRRAAFVRAAPFVAFMAFLGLRGLAPADGAWGGLDPRWLYALQVVVVGGLLAAWWREYGELARQTRPSGRETLLAVAVGIATVYIIDFTKPLFGVDRWIFTRYISYPWQVMHQVAQGVDYQWQPETWRMIALCSLYATVAFGGGLLVFIRKDLNG